MKTSELKDRLIDLVITEAISGLSDEERVELSELSTRFPEWRDDESIQLTLAALELSSISETEHLPNHVARRVLDNYGNEFASAQIGRKEDGRNGSSLLDVLTSRWLGWAMAGTFAVLLAVNIFVNRPNLNHIPTLAEQRQKLLSTSGDVIVRDWSSPDGNKFVKLSGDIVWSNSEQRGYMRFRGLPANDRSKECYQLWIFDTDQNEKFPVDGGVFDVDADDEVVIPIDAKLRIGHPTLFAVTVEKPGGVVVSSREQIAAIAKTGI